YWDEARARVAMKIAVPVKTAGGQLLGVIAGTLNFGAVETMLGRFALGETGKMYLLREDGSVVIGSRPTAAPFPGTRLAADTVRALFAREEVAIDYADYTGQPVRGALKRVPRLDWGAVADIGRDEAYAQTDRVWNRTLLLVASLLVGMGVGAYLLGLTIVRPLGRLTAGAGRVSAGDLDVRLPVADRGEVGYLTRVFNHMVTRLREGRDELAASNAALSERNRELRELSVTDGLTGLYNHKHLLETLATEVARCRRLKHPFSILMIDLDHFKEYNDTYGHLAGDAVLSRISALFKASIRNIDYAARYGGEEFCLLLPEVGIDGAMRAAERLRLRVAGEKFGPEDQPASVTISIGVAEFPEHGEGPEMLIASADAALYDAKRRGRNRVVRAGSRTEAA
ncbi:MAG: sensor domain-containing diguanylate cyclase, partial [Candidatus Rokuibacteriota bacterium]